MSYLNSCVLGRRATAVLLAIAAVALSPTQPAAMAAPVESVVGLWEKGGAARGLAYDAAIYRAVHNISPTSNVAVFKFVVPGETEPRTLAIEGVKWTKDGGRVKKGEGHSEERLTDVLAKWGVQPSWVKEIYSEREPCTLPGHNCKGMIERAFTLDGLYWSHRYPWTTSPKKNSKKAAAERATRSETNKIIADAAQKLLDGTLPSGPVMNPGGGKQRGPLPLLLENDHFVPNFSPGGIDFSSLELRYVADTGSAGQRRLRYAFRGRPGAADAAVGLQTSRQASDAFFVWLALPPQSFWVNLNPSEPNRIIDPQFARSDAGRVLLEADLLMKKAVAPLIHPDATTGAAFWKELGNLYGNRPDVPYCISFRQWIVPAPATLHETSKELYILDAPLEVKTESEHLGAGTVVADCPMDGPALNASKQEIYRRLILPRVKQAVNTHPAFAALRRVYLSRIAAEWFRQRGGKRRTALSPIANRGKIDRWIARPAWNPLTVFNQYVASVRDGEFKVERPFQSGGVTYLRPYVYGGVDFSKTPGRNVTRREFNARWPQLARQVRRSLRRPAADVQRGEIWLGGISRAG